MRNWGASWRCEAGWRGLGEGPAPPAPGHLVVDRMEAEPGLGGKSLTFSGLDLGVTYELVRKNDHHDDDDEDRMTGHHDDDDDPPRGHHDDDDPTRDPGERSVRQRETVSQAAGAPGNQTVSQHLVTYHRSTYPTK